MAEGGGSPPPFEEKLKPGIYQAVNLASLKKLQEEHQTRINECRSRAKVWAKHKDDYNALKQRLSTITDKTQYNIMVPFGGKKAFFEGQLVHTNEIMVLLGDNWFVERSAKEAGEICQRRLNRCDEMLGKIEKEIELYQSWLHEATQLGHDSGQGDGNLEIREPYDEEEETMWREKHKERVRAAKLAEKSPENGDMIDEAFWQRLDELEIEEELDAHLAASKMKQDDGEEDLSESPSITDDEDEEEKGDAEKKTDDHSESEEEQKEEEKRDAEKPTLVEDDLFPPATLPIQKKSAPEQEMRPKSRFRVEYRRAVSFGEVSERLFSREQDGVACPDELANLTNTETTIIEFEPSSPLEGRVADQEPAPKVPRNPGDILRLYGLQRSPTKTEISPSALTPKKSILRTRSKYGPPIEDEAISVTHPRVKKVGMKSAKFSVSPIVEAVNETVVEREPPPVSMKSTKFTVSPIVKAVNDVVIEREPTFPEAASPDQQQDDPPPLTSKFSRFRATRVNQ